MQLFRVPTKRLVQSCGKRGLTILFQCAAKAMNLKGKKSFSIKLYGNNGGN
ncbi:MAG: hypothetical protein WCK85_09515 [Chlorobium sp.]